MAQTWKARTIAYLESQGYTKNLKTRTTKYAAYTNGDKTYFLGNFGAIRLSATGKSSEAYSVTDLVRPKIRAWEKEYYGEDRGQTNRRSR